MRRSSYAVWWMEDSGPRHVGKLEVARLHALLSGNGSGRLAVPLDDITAVEYRRGEVRIDRRSLGPVRIGSLDAPGVLLELAQSLGSRRSREPWRERLPRATGTARTCSKRPDVRSAPADDGPAAACKAHP
jgi:hypothetical protein